MDSKSRDALAPPKAVSLGGHDWYLSPLTPGDFGELWEHLRSLAIADVQSPLAAIAEDLKGLDPADRAAAIREAVALKAGARFVEPAREAVSAKALTLDGVRFNFWLAARPLHPELTRERAAELVDEPNRHRVMAALMETNGRPQDDDPKGSGRPG